ncbi:MAG: zinc-ribbon domain-containing protein [Candidatus Heimdallarchaeota archaeon]
MSTSHKAYTVGHVWTILFGVVFTIYGIIAIITGLYVTLSIGVVGVILLIVGISSITNYRLNRKKVIGALKSYERVSLSHLSSELRMSKRKIKGFIINLRADGKLRASFEPETGDVLILEVDGEPPIAIVPMSSSGLPEHEEKYKDKQIPKEHDYCSYCGSMLKPGDQFCNNCGSFLG